MSERTEEQKAKSRENARRFRERHPEAAREANKKWREAHPEKVKEANRKPRPQRPYDSTKRSAWREKRLTSVSGYRERINAQTNTRATAIRRWLDAYKLAKGCIDCGYKSHPHALHFDHVGDDKKINVCQAKSIDQAKREIAKCVVRCANCHCVVTHHRRQSHKSPGKSGL